VSAGRPEDTSSRRAALPRGARIRLGKEIRALLRDGARSRRGAVEVFAAKAPGGGPRYGTVVPKHGHTGVERNRLRRRLREIGRMEVLPRLRQSGCHVDVLVRARPRAYDTPFPALRAELIRFTEQLCSEGRFSV
jgi:ribonuclease P protein component